MLFRSGQNIVNEILAFGGEAMFLKTDVLNREILEENLNDIMIKYGTIDALINMAGGNMPGATIAPDGTIFDIDVNQFRTVVDLNLTGTVLPTQVFLKVMAENKRGNIINISSMASFRPMTRVAGYAAAKAAINNFTAFLATELSTKFSEKIKEIGRAHV